MATRRNSYLAAVAMLLASGMLYHLLARDTAELDIAAARVAQAPRHIGDWHAQDEPADNNAFAKAGAKSYWVRLYVHERSKASVLVILMCGRAGKMSVHTPEVCYRGAGYEMHGEPLANAVKSVDGADLGQLWTAQFVKKIGETMSLRLSWAWNARGPWEASAAPRWQYRGEPFLYKLYVSREMNRSGQIDPATDFLPQFLPMLNQTLFPNDSEQ